MDVLYDMPKDCANVAVLGSSTIQHGFLHMDFYNKTRLNVLPLATSSERIEMTYYKLLEMYKTQKPELIIVDLYLSSEIWPIEDEKYLHIPLDALRLNFNKINAIRAVVPENKRQYYYFKLLYYNSNWKKLLKDNVNEAKQRTNDNIIIKNSYNSSYKGSKYIENFNVNLIYEVKVQKSNKRINPYLIKIIDIAKQNNSKIIFTVYPKVVEKFEIQIYESLKEYAKNDEDIYFINMCEKINEIGLDKYSDFLDEEHVNVSGAKKVTEYLTEYIHSLNIDFHEKGNKDIWDEAYKQYLQME